MPEAQAPVVLTESRITADWLQGMVKQEIGAAFSERMEESRAKGRKNLEQGMLNPPSRTPLEIAQSVGVNDDRGLTFARIGRAYAAGRKFNMQPADFARKNMSYAPEVAQALESIQIDSGGAMISGSAIAEFVEFLRAVPIIRSFGPNFGRSGKDGTYEIGAVTGGYTASYSGEARNILVSNPTTANFRAAMKKLTAMAVNTHEFFKRADADGDRIIRDDLAASWAEREDLSFIRGAGTEFGVKGLRNRARAANIIPATSAPTLQQVVVDLQKAWLAIRRANFRILRLGWMWEPRTTGFLWTRLTTTGAYVFQEEMAGGTLWGIPYRDTTLIPYDLGVGGDESEIYLNNFAGVTVIDGEEMRLDQSGEASVTIGNQVVSLFGTDQMALRLIGEHDIIDRWDGRSTAVLTEVDWTT
jgi:HK97 family phage major capsid protein